MNMKTALLPLSKVLFIGILTLSGTYSAGADMFIYDIEEPDPTDTAATHRQVEFLTISTETVHGEVNILWESSFEINNSHFTVERSLNAQDWNPLGAIEGAGNSNQNLAYSFLDKNPLGGISYYRIRHTDNDGNHAYSKAEAVEMPVAEMTVQIYPQPANDQIRFNLHDDSQANIELTILASDGTPVRGSITQSSSSPLSISDLNPGVYFIMITTDKETEVLRMMKN